MFFFTVKVNSEQTSGGFMFESAKSAARALKASNDLYYFDKMQTSGKGHIVVGQLTKEVQAEQGIDVYTAGMIANSTCRTINQILQGEPKFKSIYDNMEKPSVTDNNDEPETEPEN